MLHESPLLMSTKIHISVDSIHKIPHLARVLWRPFKVWQVDLMADASKKSAFSLLFPSTYTAILLPDSMTVHSPEDVAKMLRWFRKTRETNDAHKQWKLIFRPRLREWLLNLAYTHREMSKSKTSKYKAVFDELNKLAPLSVMDPGEDHETPLEDAPFMSPRSIPDYDLEVGTAGHEDEEKLKKNDELLVQWYARWTTGKYRNFRRFCIIYNGPDAVAGRWRREWLHVSIFRSLLTSR